MEKLFILTKRFILETIYSGMIHVKISQWHFACGSLQQTGVAVFGQLASFWPLCGQFLVSFWPVFGQFLTS